jgi:hypothetical protein
VTLAGKVGLAGARYHKSMEPKSITEHLFDDAEWNEERRKLGQFVVSAGVGLTSLLVLSRDKLPSERLVEYWDLYRCALISSATCAFSATVLVYAVYRNRHAARKVGRIRDELPMSGGIGKLVVRIMSARARLDPPLFWASLALTMISLLAAVFLSALLVVMVLWDPLAHGR